MVIKLAVDITNGSPLIIPYILITAWNSSINYTTKWTFGTFWVQLVANVERQQQNIDRVELKNMWTWLNFWSQKRKLQDLNFSKNKYLEDISFAKKTQQLL